MVYVCSLAIDHYSIKAWSQAETIMLVRWAFVHHTVSNSGWPDFYV